MARERESELVAAAGDAKMKLDLLEKLKKALTTPRGQADLVLDLHEERVLAGIVRDAQNTVQYWEKRLKRGR